MTLPVSMNCVWLERGELSLRAVARPEPPESEALVRVHLAGICATDLELVRGYYPYTGVPGHEFVGEVVLPGGCRLKPGLRVVGEINAWCGECSACRAGRRNHCERRTVLGIVGRHGAFAEYLILPERNLHPVPPEVPDEAAVFCEPLAAALRILEQMDIRPDHRIILVGAGRLGQLVARVLATTGADLTVVAKYPAQAGRLTALGIRVADPSALEDRTADVTVEATGSPDGFALARRLTRPGGTVVLKSTYKGRLEADFSSMVVDEITLVGSRCGPFARALSLLESREVDPADLIEARYPMSRGLAAFDHARSPSAFKVLMDPSA